MNEISKPSESTQTDEQPVAAPPPRPGRARQRRQRRQQRRSMVTKAGTRPPRPKPGTTPRFNRWWLAVPLGALLFVGVILTLGALNPPETEAMPNAIWLPPSWTTRERSDEDLIALTRNLTAHQIGALYAFTGALKLDFTWSGHPDDPQSQFRDVEGTTRAFVERLRQIMPNTDLYAWIEVRADLDEDGYRLDDERMHQVVAEFARRMIEDFAFDGVMLDVKPVASGNDDFLAMIRTIRGRIGLETPLVIAVPPDLTPLNTGLNLPPIIAPGTVWDREYKQRVALQATYLVVTAYHSYRDNPLDYIQWVQYQVQTYVEAIRDINASTRLIISVPNYAENLPAHDPRIESIGGALDGVNLALDALRPTDEDAVDPRQTLYGVAIFSDQDLTAQDWATFDEKWLR